MPVLFVLLFACLVLPRIFVRHGLGLVEAELERFPGLPEQRKSEFRADPDAERILNIGARWYIASSVLVLLRWPLVALIAMRLV